MMSAFVAGAPLSIASSRTLPSSACARRPAALSMKLRVAVVGGGPAGSCAAEVFARAASEKGADIETYLFERKMDNAKPCGGAIPVCMIEEFDLPADLMDRKVRKMKMISPTNVEVDVGKTLKPDEYIGMVRREVLDGYLRDRAIGLGTQAINGLVTSIDIPATQSPDKPYTIHYTNYADVSTGKGTAETLEVDLIIGADGANSRVAKAIDAGDYQFAIAFQERIKIPDDKMKYYEELAEMYVGEDVSPDFYAWVFPVCDCFDLPPHWTAPNLPDCLVRSTRG
jgi:geranylgeranyl diphosphate/geranylgeranyl-bacteriochlorophyllide a reductase